MSDAVNDPDVSSTSGFVWTPEMTKVVAWTSAGPSIVSIVAVLVVLVFALLLYLNKDTRHALRRQSFMMLLVLLAVSVLYSGAYILEPLLTGPTSWCEVALFFSTLSTNFIQFVTMCIALNLQLVFVHGVRTEGWVKWYLSVSCLFSIGIALSGIIGKIWGWDTLTGVCYMAPVNHHKRFAWEIGTDYFWVFSCTFITLVSTIIVLGTLLWHSSRRRRVFTETQRTNNSDYDNAARAVAWRITIYPLIMIITNCVAAASDFGIDQSTGFGSYQAYVLWNAYGFLFGAMPFFYALVVIFVDPSFSGAVRRLLRSKSTEQRENRGSIRHRHSLNVTAITDDGLLTKEVLAEKPLAHCADLPARPEPAYFQDHSRSELSTEIAVTPRDIEECRIFFASENDEDLDQM